MAVHQFLSIELRRRHNDVAAAIFSVVGVTFAVLPAFVAMLAWEGFNKAKAAAFTEAATVLDVFTPTAQSAGCLMLARFQRVTLLACYFP